MSTIEKTMEKKMTPTNQKIFKKLIKASYMDCMLPAYVHQALYFYSAAVLENMNDDDTDKSIINPAAWRQTATAITKMLEELDNEPTEK